MGDWDRFLKIIEEDLYNHLRSIHNGASWNYYAPNTLQKNDGRRILFGWVSEFKLNQGWQHAISLPRDLSIDEKGRLLQKPVAELNKLRNNQTTKKILF